MRNLKQPHEFSRIEEHAFKTTGKILVVPGWLEVYGKSATTLTSAQDTKTAERQTTKLSFPSRMMRPPKTDKVEMLEKETKPPPRYNESTLLSAMETAGKRVDDEELRDAMSERGLGTPATRASIIEGLIYDKYVSREGRDLFVNNQRACDSLTRSKTWALDILASPEMTGEWEYKLKQMEQGQLARPVFMDEIKNLDRRGGDYRQTGS